VRGGNFLRAFSAIGFIRLISHPAGFTRQSPGMRVHITVSIRWWFTISFSHGLRKPNGGRNQRGSTPAARRIASTHRFNSSSVFRGPHKKRLGCVSVWLPRACPLTRISLVRSGHSRTNFPTRKNVARALCFASRSRSFGVIAGFGPSSNVIASLFGAPVRQIVGPKSCARGYAAPYAVIPASPPTIAEGTPNIHGFIDNILARPRLRRSYWPPLTFLLRR
jgi:hypothetical protein